MSFKSSSAKWCNPPVWNSPAEAENQLDRALTSLIGYAATTGVEGLDAAVSALREFADERGGQDAFEDRTRKRGKR